VQGEEEPISLGPFRINLASTRVHRDGIELELRPRAFRVLKALIKNPGRLVEYEQMIREAWDGVKISKHTVAVTVSEIKQMLAEYGSWIQCQPKFGYRLEIPQSEVLIRKAWHYWNQYNHLGYENALCCFEEAAKLDGADYRAWEGISSAYLMLASFVMRAPRELARSFWEAHERAVEACGQTWDLRLNAAYARFVFEHDLEGAERELVQLQRERPNSAHVYIRLAMVYLARRRLEEARSLLPPALAADALLPPLAFIGCLVRLYRREFAAAIEWAENNLDLHPSSPVLRLHYAEALEFAGRIGEAQTNTRWQSPARIPPSRGSRRRAFWPKSASARKRCVCSRNSRKFVNTIIWTPFRSHCCWTRWGGATKRSRNWNARWKRTPTRYFS